MLLQCLPLLAVTTPKRRIAHELVWGMHLGTNIAQAGQAALGVRYPEFSMCERGSTSETGAVGKAALDMSPTEMATFIKFYM